MTKLRANHFTACFSAVVFIFIHFFSRVLHLDGFTSELVGEVPVVRPSNTVANISLTVPCGFFSRGGVYSLQLQQKSSSPLTKFADISDLSGVQVGLSRTSRLYSLVREFNWFANLINRSTDVHRDGPRVEMYESAGWI